MRNFKNALGAEVCTASTLKKIMVALLAVMLAVNLSPIGAFRSYAANLTAGSTKLGAEATSAYTVGDKGYNTLQAALNSLSGKSGEIVVNQESSETLSPTIYAGTNVTLKTAPGASLKVTGKVTNNGAFNVEGDVAFENAADAALVNNGTLSLEDGVTVAGGNKGKNGTIWQPALLNNADGTISSIRNCTITGNKFGITNKGAIGVISDGHIQAVQNGIQNQQGSIQAVRNMDIRVTQQGVGIMVNNPSGASKQFIGAIEGCSIQAEKGAGIYVNDASWKPGDPDSIGRIDDAEMVTDGGIEHVPNTITTNQSGTGIDIRVGSVGEIAGHTSVTAGFGISLAYFGDGNTHVGTIRGGVAIEGTCASSGTGPALFVGSNGSIDRIEGGSFIGHQAGIHNQGSIVLNIPSENTLYVCGQQNAILGDSGNKEEALTLTGEGKIIVRANGNGGFGSVNAGTCASDAMLIEPEITGTLGNGRYRTAHTVGNTETAVLRDPNDRGAIITPSGYHVSHTKLPIPYDHDNYHFLVKDNTIIFNGNGRNIGGITAEDSFDIKQLYFKEFESSSVKLPAFDGVSLNNAPCHVVGWSLDSKGEEGYVKVNDDYDMPYKDVMLYAQWGYKVTFNSDNDNDAPSPDDQYVREARNAEKPKVDLKKKGYKFDDWHKVLDPERGTMDAAAFSFESTPIVEDTILKAKWKPIEYTVNFNSNGAQGGSMENQEFKYDEKKALQQNGFVRTGYSFAGWNTKADGSGKAYADGAEVLNLTEEEGGTVQLYAQWAVNPYTITFDSNGGSAVAPIKQDFGTAITAPLDPVREGYTFEGWEPALPATMPAQDMTLVARWAEVVAPVPGADPTPTPEPDPTPQPTPNPTPSVDPQPTVVPNVDPAPQPSNPEPTDQPSGDEPVESGTPQSAPPVSGPSTASDPEPATPAASVAEKTPAAPQPQTGNSKPRESTPSTTTTPRTPITVFAPLPPVFGGGATVADAEGADDSVEATPVAREPISDNRSPQAQPQESESIADEDNPLAAVQAPGFWSLADLLATLVAIVSAVVLAVLAFRSRKKKTDDQASEAKQSSQNDNRVLQRGMKIPLIIGAVIAAVCLVALFITQDFTQSMALFDVWSPLFILGGVANVVVTVLAVRRKTRRNDSGGTAPAPAAA